MLCTFVLSGASFLPAQEVRSPKVDVAVIFIAERSLGSATADEFWTQGESIKLGADSRCGLGTAANVSGTYTNGSLTLNISHANPGAAKESNWLSAADAPFSAILRVYMPGDKVINGTWKKPPITLRKNDRVLSHLHSSSLKTAL
jgi:hypothetical protein